MIAQQELGVSGARKLMLSGCPVTAEQAMTMGVVDQVVRADDLTRVAVATAQSFATIPPKTYAAVKAQLRGDVVARIDAAMEAGANEPEGGWFNDETRDAMRAMIG